MNDMFKCAEEPKAEEPKAACVSVAQKHLPYMQPSQVSSPLDFLRKFLILFLQPFCQGVTTRLPFIYYVIHLDAHFGKQIIDTFGSKWFPIGCFVAAFQACRVITNVVTLYLPRFSHLTGSLAGLAGFAVVLGNDSKDNLAIFVTGTVMVGLSETYSSMQGYCKAEYTTDLALLQHKLKLQYSALMAGVVFGFLTGGFIYQAYKIDGVAIFGSIVMSIQVLSTITYFLLIAWKARVAKRKVVELKAVSTYDQASAEVVSKFRADAFKARKLTDEFSEGKARANSIAYLIAFTMGFEALTIGYNLSIGPIFLLTEFNQDVSIIGILFAAGASCGTISAVSATLTTPGKWFFNKHLPTPLNIYVALGGIGCSVLLAATPILEMHVLGLLLLMAFNDLAATWLIEVQGAVVTRSAYKIVGPLAQIVRRSINTITAITGPLLFGIWPRSPYYVAGGLTLIWTVLVVVFLEKRRAATRSLLKEKLPEARYKAVMKMKWERQELIHQIILDKGSTAGAKLTRGLEMYGSPESAAAAFLQKLSRGRAVRHTSARTSQTTL